MKSCILSRNPFVNQVSFFAKALLESGELVGSQSLRKSGQFLYQPTPL